MFWEGIPFGAGNLELPLCGIRGWIEPVDDRTALYVFADVAERPELYDFLLFASGVVREEAGVGILRGNMDGERDEGRDVANGIGAVGKGAGASEG